ncbi:MAG: beta-ketoacyl-ACP reductase [Phenylobacterium sp.]|jgi:acetoacetyl-CoA reductase|uniref:beta-ketoacyl-ACP reductase n=2 Tax=Phenylobacterium sp. TaxID=1871053 RepID=UPI0025E32A63|nr:beta-ketoacyl-ACP reductase [Phenylobacterium sp.]MCA3724771.1 beta-ketoacyl-ACP reductase [Phenylobacterium sp.]MCA3725515.1 beta-ketoacyl-ACP reductase [Phenylobacterium sp.]MCA3739620.1 beta-ketoacyl-ACP reductase [Phenylobacterium sp.]MCA3750856.1 beta-ketoacyl-ACP reductase [Phenylobacterium sp.]MCA3758566.1 beta-ketoacyl-ACP reductase [Phenylobacterium sp.]
MARVAFVTGGTRGIGRAICERLKSDGMKVAAGYSGNEEAAQACARELGVMVVKGNVGSFEDCDRAVRAVEAELGPVDVLVNNAGITRDGVFHKMSPAQWSDVIRVNMDSVFNMTRQVIEGMREREWGRIVNISSINGQKGQMGQTNYAAAKAGMIGFTKALALENARKGVTVNCICPGYIDTEMVQAVPETVLASIIAQIPVGRLGRGEEIADMVAFLSGEHAGFVTGSTLSLNGGQYMAG